MHRVLLALGATAVAGAAVTWMLVSLDPRSVWFAFLAVWVPMAWLGTLSRAVRPRLPEWYHRLRPFELDGRVYDVMGVRLAKGLLRRGPLAVFNPDLHLPEDRTPARLAHLEQRMRDAEAAHAILLIALMAVSAHAAVRGWWGAAGWALLFNVVINGYPVMLQRYNRALLTRRFGSTR